MVFGEGWRVGRRHHVLPVLTNCLDDDATETRRLACVVVRHAVDQLGSARLNEEAVRALYPELLKRLDDASDGVRLTCCEPLAALLAAASYSPTYAAGANLNKTNLQYFLRGLLVHLDDPAAEIQRAVAAVLRAALPLDAGVFTDEVKAVREAVGINEVHNFGKYLVTGPNARDWLDRIMAGRIPKQGRVSLTPMLSPKGRLIGDFTVSCLNDETFQLTASYGAQAVHMRWFERNATEGVRVENISDRLNGFQIAGPRARDLLTACTRDNVADMRFMDRVLA